MTCIWVRDKNMRIRDFKTKAKCLMIFSFLLFWDCIIFPLLSNDHVTSFLKCWWFCKMSEPHKVRESPYRVLFVFIVSLHYNLLVCLNAFKLLNMHASMWMCLCTSVVCLWVHPCVCLRLLLGGLRGSVSVCCEGLPHPALRSLGCSPAGLCQGQHLGVHLPFLPSLQREPCPRPWACLNSGFSLCLPSSTHTWLAHNP